MDTHRNTCQYDLAATHPLRGWHHLVLWTPAFRASAAVDGICSLGDRAYVEHEVVRPLQQKVDVLAERDLSTGYLECIKNSR